jgi:hypothetical protein
VGFGRGGPALAAGLHRAFLAGRSRYTLVTGRGEPRKRAVADQRCRERGALRLTRAAAAKRQRELFAKIQQGPVSSRGSVGVPGLYIPEMPHRAAPELDRISLTQKRKVQNAGREHDHIVVSAFPARPLGVLPQFLLPKACTSRGTGPRTSRAASASAAHPCIGILGVAE